MYVQTLYDCRVCDTKGFIGRQVDVDMRAPDYHDWEITFYVQCPKCGHTSTITLSDLAKAARRQQQESEADSSQPLKQASVNEDDCA